MKVTSVRSGAEAAPDYSRKAPAGLRVRAREASRGGRVLLEAPEELPRQVREPGLSAQDVRGHLGPREAQLLDEAAGPRDHAVDAVPEVDGLLDRVRDEEHGPLLLFPQLYEQLLHPQPDLRV